MLTPLDSSGAGVYADHYGQHTKRPVMRSPPREPTAAELLNLDIDLRLGSEFVCLPTRRYRQAFHALLRAAYGQGYYDALREQTRGQLCRDHGYAVPFRGGR